MTTTMKTISKKGLLKTKKLNVKLQEGNVNNKNKNDIINETTEEERKPRKYWHKLENQQKLFDNLYKKYELNSLEDWYEFTNKKFLENKGAKNILHKYNESLYLALKTIYPNYSWDETSRKFAGNKYWKSLINQRKLCDKFSQKFHFSSLDNWYKISSREFIAEGGASLLKYYSGSLFLLLCKVYPEHNWKAEKAPLIRRFKNKYLSSTPQSILFTIQNELKIKKKQDWYRISADQIAKISGIFKRSYGSLFDILFRCYPEEKFDKKIFSSRGKKSSQRSLFVSLSSLFPSHLIIEEYFLPHYKFNNLNNNIDDQNNNNNNNNNNKNNNLNNNNNINNNNLNNDINNNLIENNNTNNLNNINSNNINNFDDNLNKIIKKKKDNLNKTIKIISKWKNENNYSKIFIDIFIPSLNLCFEYNGEQHFNDLPSGFNSVETYKYRDHYKYNILSKWDIKSIVVPYWWNSSSDSLFHFVYWNILREYSL